MAELLASINQVVSGKVLLPTAISSYETSMRPRGVRDVELSLETAEKLHISHIEDSPFLKLGFRKQDG